MASIKAIGDSLGRRRQSFYKRQEETVKTLIEEQLIISQVRQIRKEQPKVGTCKLCLDIQELGFKIGRDKLFNLLRKYNMLVKRKKRYPSTTYSSHWLKKYSNLVRGIDLTGPNQVFVADITYLRLVGNKFAYLSLITDAWSRKIVGWNLSLSLSMEGALKALKMALRDVPFPEGLIHHSDRGIQYCCGDYIKHLKENHVLISMTEVNHCAENSLAERVNGILKDEFYLNETLPSFKIAKELTREAINTFNFKRRQMSIGFKRPAELYNC